MTGVCFVDTETTGLDPDRHAIWEVGLIDPDGREHVWQFPIKEMEADPIGLQIGRYWERHWDTDYSEINTYDAIYQAHDSKSRRKNFPTEGKAIKPGPEWCRYFQHLTAGRHLAGAVVSFDEERLRRLLHHQGVLHRWHYHLIDVEALAAGWLAAGADPCGLPIPDQSDKCRPPWDSNKLSLAVGVDPKDYDRHTALGDCRWAKAIYEAVMGL